MTYDPANDPSHGGIATTEPSAAALRLDAPGSSQGRPSWATNPAPSQADPTVPPSYPEASPLPSPDLPPLPPSPSGPPLRVRQAVVPFIAALLGIAVGAATTVAVLHRTGVAGGAVKVGPPVAAAANGKLNGVAGVAAAVLPSVVRIDVVSDAGAFGQQVRGTGSGVIYRADGYIITNNHVVEGATEVSVTLSNGEEMKARIIGTAAPVDDVAVIKVDRGGLPAATIGSAHDLHVGDTAVAIGSPFGLQSTVTAGVISALHLSFDLGQGERFTDAIQTDAPINPGNSGGALANGLGEVIGINTAIIGGNGGNVGIGFAIPIDIASRDSDQIIKTGRAERPFLGITPKTVPNVKGARLDDVVPGGPADKAGLRVGDVITAINGKTVASAEDLVAMLYEFNVGTKVTVTYTRGGSKQTTKATLAARPTG